MKQPNRKPWVCAENHCRECRAWTPGSEVPSTCYYGILHALDMKEMGLIAKPRRWGKTYRLIELLATFLEEEIDVVVICLRVEMRENFLSMMRRNQKIVRLKDKCRSSFQPLTVGQVVDGKLDNVPPSMVLMDEIDEENFAKIESTGILKKHSFVLGYYTPTLQVS